MQSNHKIASLIEQAFREVQEKHMKDMPVINGKLSIKCLGFSDENRFHDYLTGVLVTPWFMNLMLIPDGIETGQIKIGEIHKHEFPSGSYDFVTGYDDAFGYYESFTLFSPMFEFASQEAAELTAQAALVGIMNAKNRTVDNENSAEQIRQLWEGDKAETGATVHSNRQAERKRLSKRLKESSSRRDFLRGKLFRS